MGTQETHMLIKRLKHSAASTEDTIWSVGTEVSFSNAVGSVFKATKQIPGAPRIYVESKARTLSRNSLLSEKAEYQLAQDWAFIAVHEEGAHTVSACTVDETNEDGGLTINIAVNEGVADKVRSTFRELAYWLGRCARKEISIDACTTELLERIVRLCELRIVSRLKCSDWNIPRWYHSQPNPLHIDLGVVLGQLRKGNSQAIEVDQAIARLQAFVDFMCTAEVNHAVSEFGTRLDALRVAGNACDMNTSVLKIFQQGCPNLHDSTLKALRAFDKLANYVLAAKRLAHAAANERSLHLFKSIDFKFLEPYEPRWMNGSSRHVHAEIQLATFHRLRRTQNMPRTIGTSKAACYLCDLFLSNHDPRYRVSATHGQLFECWTIPDINAYSEQDRIEVKRIIRNMQKTLESRSSQRKPFLRFPNQSSIYNAPSVTSLTGTMAGQIDIGKELVLRRSGSPAAKLSPAKRETTAPSQNLSHDEGQFSHSAEDRARVRNANQDVQDGSGSDTGAKAQNEKLESVAEDSTADKSTRETRKDSMGACEYTESKSRPRSSDARPSQTLQSDTSDLMKEIDPPMMPSTIDEASKTEPERRSDSAKEKGHKGQRRRYRHSRELDSSLRKISKSKQKTPQRKIQEKATSRRRRSRKSSRKRHGTKPQRKQPRTKKSDGLRLIEKLSKILRGFKTIFCI